jgi:hypothetical protein
LIFFPGHFSKNQTVLIRKAGGNVKLEQKPVPGFEDRYYLDPENMQVVNAKTGHPLKTQYNRDGYAEVKLWRNNKGTHKNLHKLFADAYIPNPDNLPEINHKDENPKNFSLDNLEWCDHPYNMNYGTINERRSRNISAAQQGKPKPWVADHKSIPVIAIDSWGNETWFKSGREAARQLDIDQSSITAVLNGRRRKACGFTFRYA